MEPSSRTAPGLAPGDVIAGKFRLERVIGRGGMGSVWAARHVQLEMPVALKFIETEGDEADARLRFEREARAAGQIRSPHVVQILDHGIDGDRPYIAMELLEGEDLGQRLRRERRISVPACARVLTQAAKALRRAHEAGIIHRDLKPGNVFLARFDDDEVVKILDFGVAKMRRPGAIDEPLATQVGIVFGSPSYMSPEQARGVRALDHRTDLWSLAVIVYRSVTGVKPFQGASLADLVVKLCIDPLPVATHAAGDLPPEIDRFFERAFARDPEQRFASAPEMAAAFEAVAGAGAAAGAAPPISSSLPSVPQVRIAGAALAPNAASPPSGTPPSGSRSNVAFAPGTLTPPPGPMADAIRPPVLTPFPAEPIAAPPVAAPPPPAARPSWTIPKLMAAGAGVGLLALVLLVLLVRERAPAAPSSGVSAAPPPPAQTPPIPDPSPSATAVETAASGPAPVETARPASAAGHDGGDPQTPGPAGHDGRDPQPPGAGAPRGSARSGKKKRPNFGY